MTASIRMARHLLAAIALTHLVVPIGIAVTEDRLRDQIAREHLELTQRAVAASADVAVLAAAVFHGILLVLCVLPLWKLGTGRPWTRTLTTVVQPLSVVFGVVSWTSSPMFHAVIPIVSAAQLATVALLWLPGSARAFFNERS